MAESCPGDFSQVATSGLEAVVIELLPHGGVVVELESRERVLAHPAGSTKVNFVRLRLGNRVLVQLAPVDRSRGRIVKLLRLK